MKKQSRLPNLSSRRHLYDDTALGEQGLVVNPYGSEHTANAARAMVHAVFGRHGKALDQANFQDRQPGTLSSPSPEARFK